MFEQIEGHSEILDMLKESANDRGWFSTILIGVGSLLLIAAFIAAMALISGWGMTDRDDSIRVLSEQGYSHITITGYRWFTCDKNDYYHTGFSATSPKGDDVTGTVCRGMVFKSNTVRLD